MSSHSKYSRVLPGVAAILVMTSIAVIALLYNSRKDDGLTFTAAEKELISESDSLMYVYTISVPEEQALLRTPSTELTDEDIRSDLFMRLADFMVYTMRDPSQDGVGIAAPQVGVLKRVVAVQRFDKEGEPVEVYPNIRIEEYSGTQVSGQEGCLSVPGYYGLVRRFPEIVISYKDRNTLETVKDTVRGFTSVIFQHETDHLAGIIYTDKADSLYTTDGVE